MLPMLGSCTLFHYTNVKGYNGIRSQKVWTFRTSKPPGGHPQGAYFTTLPPSTPNLNKRLFVRGCADKTEYLFSFSGGEDLVPLQGGRGDYVFYSGDDYEVDESRQGPFGKTTDLKEKLR